MSDEVTTKVTPAEDEIDGAVPMLDEVAFIKRAKRRSTRRMVMVSTSVVLVMTVAWLFVIGRQGRRIEDYYPAYVAMTVANTQVVMPGYTAGRFPSASTQFTAYRRVGDVAVPAGEEVVRFNVWGGELVVGPVRQSASTADGRTFGGSGLTPELQFLEPPLGDGKASELASANKRTSDGTASDVFLGVFADIKRKSIERLQSAPPSATVEMAVSFTDLMALKQLEARIGGDLNLSWGAVRVREANAEWWPQFPGFSMGVPFGVAAEAERPVAQAHSEVEQAFLPSLRGVADRGSWWQARKARKAADYLEANGVSYYGAVVTGSPKAALALASSPDVTAVAVGAIVMPWQ